LLQDLTNPNFGGKRERARRLRAFESAWARLQSDEPGWPQGAVDRAFHRELIDWLRFHKAILIGELIPVTLSYLRNNPNCSERTAFNHILVDEYQDLNKAEQVLIDLISENGTLAVIGDDDQSIYSFKFAHPEGIIEFSESHPRTHDENLNECHRCPRNIVEMANKLISFNNRPDPGRRLCPIPRSQDGHINIVQWNTLEEEANGIAKIIHHLITNNEIDQSHILILVPRRIIGYAIRNNLQDLGIDAHSFFHEEALDNRLAQERFTLLTLLDESRDRVALRCWLGFGSPSLRSGAYNRLREVCEQNNRDPWDVLEEIEIGHINLPYSGELIGRFRELKKQLRDLQEKGIPEIIEELFPKGDDNVELIRNLALEIAESCEDKKSLREELQIRITQPELPSEGDYVRIMSLHKAKGLTADLVIVCGCVEGFIPFLDDSLSLQDQARQLEENRRLFYVAITRATKFLFLSSFIQMSAADAHKMGAKIRYAGRNKGRTIASRFLQELGDSAPSPVRGDSLLAKLGI